MKDLTTSSQLSQRSGQPTTRGLSSDSESNWIASAEGNAASNSIVTLWGLPALICGH